jgi:hypothetical protein
LSALTRHLERRTDPRAAALVRIAIGLMGVMTALVTHRDLQLMLAPGVVRARELPWLPDLPAAGAPVFAGVWLLASVLFTAGWHTRVSGITLFLCVLYRHLLDQSLHHNYIPLVGLFALLLALGDAGVAYGLDARRPRGEPPRHVALWPQTLIKFQVSVVYLYTAIAKMNPTYFEGRVFRQQLAFLPIDRPWLWTSMGVATIAIELFFGLGLWHRRTRPWAILLGTMFHLAIPFVLGWYAAFIGFSVIFLASYLLFIEYEDPGGSAN